MLLWSFDLFSWIIPFYFQIFFEQFILIASCRSCSMVIVKVTLISMSLILHWSQPFYLLSLYIKVLKWKYFNMKNNTMGSIWSLMDFFPFENDPKMMILWSEILFNVLVLKYVHTQTFFSIFFLFWLNYKSA